MRQTVSMYKRHGVWYLRYARSSGLPRRSLNTRDKSLAETIRLDEEHRLIFGRAGLSVLKLKSIPYSQFAKQFLEYGAGRGLARNTLISYTAAMNNFGMYLNKDRVVSSINLDDMERFAAHRRLQNAAVKTIRNELITLKVAFKWAKRQKYLTENPGDNLELPRRPVYPPKYLRREQYVQLKKSINDELFRDIVDYYLLTGMRRSEGIVMRISQHIDLEAKRLYVPQIKTKDYKTLPITDELEQVIGRLILRSRGADRLIPFCADHLTRKFHDYRVKAGLPEGITFHSLRHTFATWLASANVGFRTIQSLLGQSDPESTKVYLRGSDIDLRAALELLKVPTN